MNADTLRIRSLLCRKYGTGRIHESFTVRITEEQVARVRFKGCKLMGHTEILILALKSSVHQPHIGEICSDADISQCGVEILGYQDTRRRT